MITQIPMIMTKYGRQLHSSIIYGDILSLYTNDEYYSLSIRFYEKPNDKHAGTIHCQISKENLENEIEISIRSFDTEQKNQGIGTCMMFSLFRWALHTYPKHPLIFSGEIWIDGDIKYLKHFYSKFDFSITKRAFSLQVPIENTDSFYLKIEHEVAQIYVTFLSKQQRLFEEILYKTTEPPKLPLIERIKNLF